MAVFLGSGGRLPPDLPGVALKEELDARGRIGRGKARPAGGLEAEVQDTLGAVVGEGLIGIILGVEGNQSEKRGEGGQRGGEKQEPRGGANFMAGTMGSGLAKHDEAGQEELQENKKGGPGGPPFRGVERLGVPPH